MKDLRGLEMHGTLIAMPDQSYFFRADWRAAQEADPLSISTYAQDNPEREDLAETVSIPCQCLIFDVLCSPPSTAD